MPDSQVTPLKPRTDREPKPGWLRVKAPTSPEYDATRRLMRTHRLNTVCEEAACPNIGECWAKGHATVMILGSVCTRACAFCNVATGRPDALDPHEPDALAQAVSALGLDHVVVTSVDRDDLDDGGAFQFVRCIERLRETAPETTIEVLTPDFRNKAGAIEAVTDARPDVYNHNLETVPRLYTEVRPGARYYHSLRLLDHGQAPRPRDLHQVGRHGGARRGAPRNPPGDGRPALGRRGFSDHRPVSAPDRTAPRGDALRHAGRVRGL